MGPVRVKVGAGRIRAEHDDVARSHANTGCPTGRFGRLERLAGLTQPPE